MSGLPWNELLQLHVVRRTATILARRWHVDLGYVDCQTGEARAPGRSEQPRMRTVCRLMHETERGAHGCRQDALSSLERMAALARSRRPLDRPFTITCHAGVAEMVVPVLVAGEVQGALLVGPIALEGRDGDRTSVGRSLDLRVRALNLSATGFRQTQEQLSWFDERELEFVGALVQGAAEEISLYLESAVAAEPDRPVVSEGRSRYRDIIGRSAAMRELYSVLDRVVRSDATVLIQGENGTGKELVARAIHYSSDRANRRFVITNCSAFNDNLLDSELFGHRKGAFTGAIADKQGLFEVAHQGTFFLDEIGDMSPSLQVKVLRVLQEGTYLPVGDTETRKVDVRIIAATNRNLKAMVEEGSFREDLYYRINVINLNIPRLRDRLDDIELLTEHFLDKHLGQRGRPRKALSRGCIHQFLQYNWPGNVRELENEIERLIVMAGDEPEIDEHLLSPRIRRHVPRIEVAVPQQATSKSLPRSLRSLERRMILEALERHGWNKTRAASELEISRRNLIRLVQKYELEVHRSK